MRSYKKVSFRYWTSGTDSNGSSYPKNALILVDTSGSVKGQTGELLTFAVKSLLDTFDDNDYVQVARFPEAPSEDDDDSSKPLNIVECFQGLVRATTSNKRLFADKLNSLVPHGMANFNQAFKYAFDTLDRFDAEVQRATDNELGACCSKYANSRCNKMIMVLTDALTDSPDKLLAQRNADKRVKIFTYAMGFAAKEKEKLKVRVAADAVDGSTYHIKH